MLVLGAATSHAPGILLPVEHWPVAYERMTRDVPQPLSAAKEDEEALVEAKARIEDALQRLRAAIVAAEPDVVIVVGDDQNEVFGAPVNPTLAIYCGADAEGHTLPKHGATGVDEVVHFKGSPDVAWALTEGLIERGFDPAMMTEIRPVTDTEGIGHAFARPAKFLGLAELGIPIVPVFLNCYHEPLPSGDRCYQLGQAIREIADARPERIMLLGSGGLSHDPLGPRAGWIDQELDTWVLDRIRAGDTRALRRLFSFKSDSLHGGSGEIRAWITVAGAFENTSAEVIDYVPLHHTVTGLAFAYWESGH